MIEQLIVVKWITVVTDMDLTIYVHCDFLTCVTVILSFNSFDLNRMEYGFPLTNGIIACFSGKFCYNKLPRDLLPDKKFEKAQLLAKI